MEATIEERKNSIALKKSRTEDQPQTTTAQKSESSASVNPIEMILVLIAAIILDAINLLDLTVVLAILTKFITIPTAFALWYWRASKHKSGPGKDPVFQVLIAAIPKMIPFVSIVPTWTIFVLYCWIQDTKLGKKTIGKAQKLSKAKKPQE